MTLPMSSDIVIDSAWFHGAFSDPAFGPVPGTDVPPPTTLPGDGTRGRTAAVLCGVTFGAHSAGRGIDGSVNFGVPREGNGPSLSSSALGGGRRGMAAGVVSIIHRLV
jgi:hypothetical protein